jgi:hypothetical protein
MFQRRFFLLFLLLLFRRSLSPFPYLVAQVTDLESQESCRRLTSAVCHFPFLPKEFFPPFSVVSFSHKEFTVTWSLPLSPKATDRMFSLNVSNLTIPTFFCCTLKEEGPPYRCSR